MQIAEKNSATQFPPCRPHVILIKFLYFTFQDKEEKQFIYRHCRTVFDLLDEDGSQTISAVEFESFGFVFNFRGQAIKKIFTEFDVSGDKV